MQFAFSFRGPFWVYFPPLPKAGFISPMTFFESLKPSSSHEITVVLQSTDAKAVTCAAVCPTVPAPQRGHLLLPLMQLWHACFGET